MCQQYLQCSNLLPPLISTDLWLAWWLTAGRFWSGRVLHDSGRVRGITWTSGTLLNPLTLHVVLPSYGLKLLQVLLQ